MEENYDVIIIGSGAGGGTMAHELASTGKKILIIDRGDFLKREKENWEPSSVFKDERYHTEEHWYDKDDRPFRPGMCYHVGGNTKVYGAALLRLREKDFEEVKHYGGISPAWPLSYSDMKPYYLRAEQLYSVHGQRGEDPFEPEESEPYSFPAISHEPFVLNIVDRLTQEGLHPFHLPLGLRLNEKDMEKSECIRCDTCDGFPCLVHAKSDSHTTCITPALAQPNVTIMTNARANRLITDESGRVITAVEVEHEGQLKKLSGKHVIVSCGAINSAVLFLRSSSEAHPSGFANSSGAVGRNYMCHQNSVMISVSKTPNPTIYPKTMGLNDFYYNADDSELPLGHVQLLGKVKKEMLEADAPSITPGLALNFIAEHCVGWWLTSEDLPMTENRVALNERGDIVLDYTTNNEEAHQRLLKKLEHILNCVEHTHFFPNHAYLAKRLPIAAVAHQVGTLRFGKDPKTSVLDINCKAHDLDNLYVVDASFFPSSGAVNPALTIIANSIRVADHLKKEVL